MHVCFLIPMLGAGGAERVTIDIARGIKPSVDLVEIITNETTGEFVENAQKDITISSVNTYRWGAMVMRLRHHFKSARPDIVMAQGTRMSLAASLAIMGLRRKPKLVWCLHNPYSSKYKIFPKPIAWTITRVLGFFAKKTDAIIGVSEGVCGSFVEYFGLAFRAKTRVIHNPIPPYKPTQTLPDSPGTRPLLIAVGRLEHQKNFALLIDSMPAILEYLDCSLDIYGVGPLEQELTKQIARLNLGNHVVLRGYASGIRDKMKHADVFVLPSRWEGLPTVLLEAMGTGTPVVATDCTYGPDEILENGRWGKLVPSGDSPALARAIVDVLQNGGVDPTLRAKDFEPEKIIIRYIDLFRSLT